MGKYADSLDDYCPECANVEDVEQNGIHPVSSEESDYCCCCCCDCEESGGENPETGNSENTTEYKKNLLSNLSMSRVVGQPASIQNIIQFIEALTNSRSFLSEYYLRENFCLDCLTENVCDCYARSLRNLNLRDSCTCIDCSLDGESNGNETNVPGGPESSISKAASPRSENRSNQRRRRRRRLRRSRRHVSNTREQNRLVSNSHDHHLELTNDNFPHSERENESRRYRRRNQRCSPNNDCYCSCDECSPRAQMKSSESCTCIFSDSFQPRDYHSTDRYPECPTEYRSSTDNKCQLSDCELCNRDDSETLEASDTCCSDCSSMQTATSACNCCNTAHQSSKENFETASSVKKMLPSEMKIISESSPQNKSPEDDKSDQSSCDCQECQSYSEYSHDSCDECRKQSTKKDGRKSR